MREPEKKGSTANPFSSTVNSLLFEWHCSLGEPKQLTQLQCSVLDLPETTMKLEGQTGEKSIHPKSNTTAKNTLVLTNWYTITFQVESNLKKEEKTSPRNAPNTTDQ